MRIVGGYLKGRTLKPKGKISARPTTDFAKEALFNILENRLDLTDLKVLELFAGTGNITMEFISRGVGSVTAVEQNSECLTCIRSFATEMKAKNVTTIKSEVFKWLKRPTDKGFDLVFCDPPYDLKELNILHQSIFESGVLNENNLVIVEHGREIDFSTYPFFVFHRKYGNVNFSFFEFIKTE